VRRLARTPLWSETGKSHAYTPLTSIEIPDGVASIGHRVFYFCKKLESVTFAANSSLTTIGGQAFSYCTKLTSIDIPDGVASIGYWAFHTCTSLKSVTFAANSSLTTIGDSAFSSCTKLTSIDIPDGVASIDKKAFSYCYALTSVDIPDGVASIGYAAFYSCYSLKSVSFGSAVMAIEEYAFGETSLICLPVGPDVSIDYRSPDPKNPDRCPPDPYTAVLVDIVIPGGNLSSSDFADGVAQAIKDVYNFDDTAPMKITIDEATSTAFTSELSDAELIAIVKNASCVDILACNVTITASAEGVMSIYVSRTYQYQSTTTRRMLLADSAKSEIEEQDPTATISQPTILKLSASVKFVNPSPSAQPSIAAIEDSLAEYLGVTAEVAVEEHAPPAAPPPHPATPPTTPPALPSTPPSTPPPSPPPVAVTQCEEDPLMYSGLNTVLGPIGIKLFSNSPLATLTCLLQGVGLHHFLSWLELYGVYPSSGSV